MIGDQVRAITLVMDIDGILALGPQLLEEWETVILPQDDPFVVAEWLEAQGVDVLLVPEMGPAAGTASGARGPRSRGAHRRPPRSGHRRGSRAR